MTFFKKCTIFRLAKPAFFRYLLQPSSYLKKAGLASRNIVHFLKKVILRCIGLCFNYHHLYLLSRLDQPLIQRIPAGLSSTVACLDITRNRTTCLSNLEIIGFKKFLGLPNWTRPTASSNLAVLGIFLIQLFPNTACSPITYTNLLEGQNPL